MATPRNRPHRAASLLATIVVALAAGGAQARDIESLERSAREASSQLLQQIAGELKREFALSGTLRSVVVCKYTAPEVSSAVSKRYGAQVRRVSLKVRNPALGTPDAWEQERLIDFDHRVARGEDPATLEATEVVTEPAGEYFRYLKAIPTGTLCLSCHGTPDQLTSATQAQLAAEYPHDRAIGYRIGQIRGAVSFKKLIEDEAPP